MKRKIKIFFKRLKRYKYSSKPKIALIVSCIALLLIVGLVIDNTSRYKNDEIVNQGSPYIVVTDLPNEVPLVGDKVLDWLNNEAAGSELYKRYAQYERVYSSNPVNIKYAIYDIPNNCDVIKQEIEVSLNKNFESSEKILIDNSKRNVELYNLFVDCNYYYTINVTFSNGETITHNGSFKTKNTPRILDVDGVWNFRDIGGIKTQSGKKIKQGLLYRGTELDGAVYSKYVITQQSIDTMLNTFGIKTEIDLRPNNTPQIKDMLGESVNHKIYGFLAYSDCFLNNNEATVRKLFSDLADKNNYPIYVHCTYGKDRTGTLCYLLETLLGVSDKDAFCDWEISVLMDGYVNYENMDIFVNTLKSYPGESMQQKTENYLLSVGVKSVEIERIKEIFLED